MTSEKSSPDKAVPPETWEFPVEDGLVVARPDLPSLFCLNRSARIIWAAYRETGSEESTAATLAETFGIPLDLAQRDTQAAVNGWAAAGLLGQPRPAEPLHWEGTHGDPLVLAYCSLEGTAFLLLTDSPAVIAEVTPRLVNLSVAPCEPDVTIAIWSCANDRFAIVVDDTCIAVEQGAPAARAVLFQELAMRACPGRKWLALLHAGACGIDGRCVLFPASSYSGKSTLAAALMASGFDLYSDDFLGISANSLQIPPMPFAIALRRGSWDVLRPLIPHIEDSPALERASEQLRFLPIRQGNDVAAGEATAIVFTQWAADAAFSEQRLSTADVISRLSQAGFWVRHDRDSIGAFLAWLERLPKSTLRYSDLSQAIGYVTALATAPGGPTTSTTNFA